MKQFRTSVEEAKEYHSTRLRVGNKMVTRIPVVHEGMTVTLDNGVARPMVARMSYKDCLTWGRKHGASLVSAQTIIRLDQMARESGLCLVPCTQPDQEMKAKWYPRRPGETDKAYAKRVYSDMQSLEWAAYHDKKVWEAIEAASWDGFSPLSNFTKLHRNGAPPGRCYIMGWSTSPGHFIQPQSEEGSQGPHNDGQFDYGTGAMFEWDIEGAEDEEPTKESEHSFGSRTLRKGLKGADVKQLQLIVGATADGDFGPGTEAKLKAWQGAHGLTADGIAGPKTLGVLALGVNLGPSVVSGSFYDTDPAPPPKGAFDMTKVKFVRARHFRGGRLGQVTNITLHDMEWKETPTTAEACAAMFATEDREASCHFCVDNNSIVQCVALADTAFAAPGTNHNGIQIELAGFARQTEEEWADDYSTAMLEQAAQLVAYLCAEYGIPAVFLDASALLRGDKGITTHGMVSKAFKKSTHTDPGPNFPMSAFIARVNEILEG